MPSPSRTSPNDPEYVVLDGDMYQFIYDEHTGRIVTIYLYSGGRRGEPVTFQDLPAQLQLKQEHRQ